MKTYFSLKSILNPPAKASPVPLTPRDMLIADIRKTQCALETAYSGFDYVTDPDLIDCYIYEVNSALKRYRFLLQQAQDMQLCEGFHAGASAAGLFEAQEPQQGQPHLCPRLQPEDITA